MIGISSTHRCLSSRRQLLCFQSRLKSTIVRKSTTQKSARSSLFQRLWKSYNRNLKEKPITTKCVSAAIIFFSSDLATQAILHEYETRKSEDEHDGELSLSEEGNLSREGTKMTSVSFDLDRALSGATFGVVGSTWIHFWWGALEKLVQARIPVGKHRLGNTLTKVAIDQLIGAPLYIYFYFFITNFVKSPNKTQAITAHDRSVDMLWPTMQKHWSVWPGVHTLNFYYIPLQHRVLFQNMVLVGWSGYLSYLNNNVQTQIVEGGSEKDQVSGLRRRETMIGLDCVEGN